MHPWKVLLRAFGFGCYGLASLGLGWIALPLQRLEARLRGAREDPQVRAQRAIHRTTHAYLRGMQALGLVRLDGRGVEKLRERPLLVVANHPSLIDSPVLTHFMPQADFIVSSDWSRNPVLRRTVEAAGYLHVERGPVVVRDAVKRLRAGRSLVVYPEGSRTPPEGLRAFQRGAAHIALRAGCDIVPVVITVTPRSLMKGQSFGEVPERCPTWRVEVGEPIRPTDHVRAGEAVSDTARRVTAVLQEYFSKRWDRGI